MVAKSRNIQLQCYFILVGLYATSTTILRKKTANMEYLIAMMAMRGCEHVWSCAYTYTASFCNWFDRAVHLSFKKRFLSGFLLEEDCARHYQYLLMSSLLLTSRQKGNLQFGCYNDTSVAQKAWYFFRYRSHVDDRRALSQSWLTEADWCEGSRCSEFLSTC